MRTVLGIDTDEDLIARWRGWFAPERQLFAVPPGDHPELDLVPRVDLTTVPNETRCTVAAYEGEWVMLDRTGFEALPWRTRRALKARRDPELGAIRWPEDLAAGDQPVIDFVEVGIPDSAHGEVPEETWEWAATLLPRARELAGTWPEMSGPNCFGAVMAAAGMPGAELDPMAALSFEPWLAENARPLRGTALDELPGTVLVWREPNGLAVHTCVTLGHGWAFNKPTQGWFSPWLVWTVRQAIRRHPGARLHRYTLAR